MAGALISHDARTVGRTMDWGCSWCVNAVCLAYALLLSIIFETCFALFSAVFLLLDMGRADEVCRLHNGYYGAFMVRMFWPFVRLRRRGLEHLRRRVAGGPSARPAPVSGLTARSSGGGLDFVRANRPVMMVTNHRSLFDIFFFGLVSLPNVAVLVRSWPFRIPVVGWFMRRGGYIDVERVGFNAAVYRVEELSRRGASWLCFVEGHRSRDGLLQRFHSGAFRLAVACDLPVVPVCLTGTERLCAPGTHQFNPTKVTMKFFPEIDPASFPVHKRALKLRRHVEGIFREYLGERGRGGGIGE